MYENRVELLGFLGKNPGSKTTKKSGRKLVILSLATKTWWTDANEQRYDQACEFFLWSDVDARFILFGPSI